MDAEAIDNAVRRLARELDRDYADRPPVLVGVLKDGFIFLADLVRRMQVSVLSVEFLRLSSYGGNTVSSGAPRIVVGLLRRRGSEPAPGAGGGQGQFTEESPQRLGYSGKAAELQWGNCYCRMWNARRMAQP